MAKPTERIRLATSGEELGTQMLQSVREMKVNLRERAHTPASQGIVEARLGKSLVNAIRKQDNAK